MANPLAFYVDEDEEWSQQSKLHIGCNRPAPEEAAVVACLEVGVHVADHEELGPPVIPAIVEHRVCCVPDRAGTELGEDAPPTKEDKVVHGCKAKVFTRPKLQNIFHCQFTLGMVKAEQLVGAKKSRERSECFHDQIATDYNRKDNLGEEFLNHPWVDRLSAHKKLCSDAELAQEEAEEFDTFKYV